MVSAHQYDMTAGCSAWSHPPRILLLLVLNKRARTTALTVPLTMDRSLGGPSRRTLGYRTIARRCQASGPGTACVHLHVRCSDILRCVNRVRRVISGCHRSGTLVSKQSTIQMIVPSYQHVSRLICFQHSSLRGTSAEWWIAEGMTVEMRYPLLIL